MSVLPTLKQDHAQRLLLSQPRIATAQAWLLANGWTRTTRVGISIAQTGGVTGSPNPQNVLLSAVAGGSGSFAVGWLIANLSG